MCQIPHKISTSKSFDKGNPFEMVVGLQELRFLQDISRKILKHYTPSICHFTSQGSLNLALFAAAYNKLVLMNLSNIPLPILNTISVRNINPPNAISSKCQLLKRIYLALTFKVIPANDYRYNN